MRSCAVYALLQRAIVRFRFTERIRSGRLVMAKVIEFYVPQNYLRRPLKSVPAQPGGRIVEFCSQNNKSA